jgi:hypothetical protein
MPLRADVDRRLCIGKCHGRLVPRNGALGARTELVTGTEQRIYVLGGSLRGAWPSKAAQRVPTHRFQPSAGNSDGDRSLGESEVTAHFVTKL